MAMATSSTPSSAVALLSANNTTPPTSLPPLLLKGDKFDIWTDDAGQTIELDASLRIDESGLFLHWKSQGKEPVIVDCLQISDVRPGSSPKDPQLAWDLELKGSGSLNYRTICICTGLDFVSQSYINVAAYDETKAKQWTEALKKVVHSTWLRLTSHASPMWQLHKLWLRIRLTTDAQGRILAKTVAKALGSQASATYDRLVYDAMQEMGLIAVSASSPPSVPSTSSLTAMQSPAGLPHSASHQSFQYSASIASSSSSTLVTPTNSNSATVSNNNNNNNNTSSSNNNNNVPSVGPTLSSSVPTYFDDAAVDLESFTFEKFFTLFKRFCPRPEVEAIFLLVCGKDDVAIPLTPSSSSSSSSSSSAASSLTALVASCLCTIDQMKSFLNRYQRDPRHNEILRPYYNQHDVQLLIDNYEPDPALRARSLLSYAGFLRYILTDSDPIDTNMLTISQDMDQPLTHYYVSTSHNTYLIGRQFGGKSSVDMYRLVLLSGCRSVEIDCWDGNNGEPIVTHGKAMCTDISYKDVLLAIKETAFLTSPLPVTLSFENHCSRQQQFKLAKYAEEIFGDMLLREPLPSHPLRPGVSLPSPNSLRYKILIKNKRLRPEVEQQQLELFHKGLLSHTAEDNSADVDDNGAVDPLDDGAKTPTPAKDASMGLKVEASRSPVVNGSKLSVDQRKSVGAKAVISNVLVDDAALLDLPSDQSSSTSSALPGGAASDLLDPTKSTGGRDSPSISAIGAAVVKPSSAVTSVINAAAKSVISSRKNAISSLSPAEEAALLTNYQHQGATANVHPYLSSFINYTQPIKFQGFDVAEARNIHHHMSSFNENAGLALLKEQAIEFVNYNKRQFSRIYPRGTRYDSSNFNPQIFWSAGCQMVALNFQTNDLAMQLNQGRFEYNGRSGYLLKPDFLRRSDRNNFNPFSEAPVDGLIAATCTVQILSAQFLTPDRRCGSYVEVDMYGLPADTIRKEFRTRLVPSNGFNPVYVPAVNGDPLPGAIVFRKVVLPDLAVLRLAIFDETGRLLGQRILPLDGLQAGFRHVSLRSEGSVPLPLATLFCRISLDTYVPDGVGDFVSLLADPLAFETLAERRHCPVRHLPQRFTASADQEPIFVNGTLVQQAAESGNSSPSRDSMSPIARKTQSNAVVSSQSEQLAETIIRVEQLQSESKSYQKMVQQQQRELQKLKKRQNREKLDLANKHYKALPCSNKDSPILRKIRQSTSSGDMLRARSASAIPAGGDSAQRCIGATVVSALAESAASSTSPALEIQAHEYTQLVQKCLREERDCQVKQAEARIQFAKTLLASAQEQQLRERFQRHEREFKDLELQQARQMKESVGQITDDKSISKQEKDRKIRELKESNIKRFCEERKRLVLSHERQRDQLIRFHSTQMELLDNKLREEISQIESAYEEERLGASRPQIIV